MACAPVNSGTQYYSRRVALFSWSLSSRFASNKSRMIDANICAGSTSGDRQKQFTKAGEEISEYGTVEQVVALQLQQDHL